MKILVDKSPEWVYARLKEQNCTHIKDLREVDYYMDTPELSIAKGDQALRVRISKDITNPEIPEKLEITFKGPKKEDKDTTFTYHDPCRLSRFLPEEVNLTKKSREIFDELMKLGFNFKEMKHNKENSLCCGVNSWMNCNEKSKALRYKRMLEAKSAAPIMITSCPKCELHFKCLQNDFEDISSINILDFSEFIINNVEIIAN